MHNTRQSIMKSIINLTFIFILLIVTSCFAPMGSTSSTLESSTYNDKTNTTDYMVFPLGSVSLPGEWTKTHYADISHQQWFKNADSISVAVAFTACDYYEFSKKDLKDFAFVKAYYEWDAKYLSEQLNIRDTILLADTVNNYIVWRLWGESKKIEIDSYFLFGCRNCSVSNFSITANKWPEEQNVKFLLDLYLKKD